MGIPGITVLVVMLVSALAPCAVLAQTYEEEIVRARVATANVAGIGVEGLRLGPAVAGSHELQLKVTNTWDTPSEIRLKAVVVAGMGAEHGTLEKTATLAPGTHQVLKVPYTLQRLTPFSRVTAVVESRAPGEDDSVDWQRVFRSRVYLGIGNPTVEKDFDGLARRSGRQIDAYFVPGSLAEKEIQDILAVREGAITKIEAMLDMVAGNRIRLFLYPDAELKFDHTGHQGMGWAYGDFIAEIYNEGQKLDPFHELAHILVGQMGQLPAFLDEGYATYISEAFGEDALEFMGNSGRGVDEVAAELVRDGRARTIHELIAVENIGNSRETSEVEYPQSASLVKFIVETHGPVTTGKLFRAFGKAGTTPDETRAILEGVLGLPVEALNAAWIRALAEGENA